MLLLLLACSSEPAPPVEAAPPPVEEVEVEVAEPVDVAPSGELDLTRPEPFATGEGAVPVPVEDRLTAIKRACIRLEECGCVDEQPYEACVQSAHGTTLPDTVYRCIASRPCEKLCAPNAQGTADKGLTDCVQPYVEEQIGGKGKGLNKHVRTEKTR